MIWVRELKLLWQKAVYSDSKKTVFQKWKQSLLAITLALLLTFVLILIKGQNPLFILLAIFQGATRNAESLSETLLYYAMFILAGLAVTIAFRSGLFNIGVAGQMLISGTVMMMLAVQTSLPWIVLIIIGMITGALAAAFAGFLKASFNIHEVVSSILINWIFFYVSQYLLDPARSWVDEYGTTLPIAPGSRMQIGESLVVPALTLAAFLLVSALVLFKTTKWGFALKVVGQNPDAAHYAGIKVGWQLVLGMGLSGLVAGALASVNYLGKFGTMSQAVGASLPAIGFQGISVALIAFKSFSGLIPAAFFWAVITAGANYVSILYPAIPPEVLALMNGFIIYMVAVSIIFIRFRPLKILWLFYLQLTSPEIKNERTKLKVAKTAQRNLFATRYAQIKTLDQAKEKAAINALKLQQQKVQVEIKMLQRVFQKANKRPFFLKMLFARGTPLQQRLSLASYYQAVAIWEQKASQSTAAADAKYETLALKMQVLSERLAKKLVAKNKALYHNGLLIIENEFKARKRRIYETKTKASFLGTKKQNYLLKKNQIRLFEEKYNLLKLELKTNLKTANSKVARQNLKQAFLKNVLKLETLAKSQTRQRK